MSDTMALWLIALPLLGAPLVQVLGRVGRRHGQPTRPLVAQLLTLSVLALTWAVWLELQFTGSAIPPEWQLAGQRLRYDGLSAFVALLALGIATLVVIFSMRDVSGAHAEDAYYALILIETGAVLALACATDLFNMWLWFEIMAIVSYVLVVFFRSERASLEAGFKYLVQSASASLLAVMGIALVLAATGTVDLDQIGAAAGGSPVLLAGGGLLLVGFGTKAGLVPLHAWLPDAYAQAPGGVSALLSGVVTKLGLVALLRALAAMAGVGPNWGLALLGFGALTMLVGNLVALRQQQLKRLLAWSSLAHIGYAVLGVGIGVFTAQPLNAQGGVFHLLTHAVMSGAAFLAVGALLYGCRRNQRAAANLTLTDVAGVARRYPAIALALSAALLGLAGLPPFAGFMSEWQMFVAGFDSRNPLLIGLVVFLACNVVVSLGYYTPVVLAAYRHAASDVLLRGVGVPLSMTATLIVLSLTSVALGIAPGLASGLVAPAAKAVVRAFGG
jgi:proton-translocating NADH-quinone oxidoreductase chain N